MWHSERVSVVLMTYAEKGSIRETIEGFFATGVVDEILVVDNNAEPGTRARIEGTRARQVHEEKQGYGFATRRGLAEATGDIIVLCEPDGTFLPGDIFKLLIYADDCDMVLGTRTTRELLWHGANMGGLLRWGNWAVAKLIEVLFNTSHLSDVGCTYRLLRRSAVERIEDRFSVGGEHFGPELMLLCLTSDLRIIEVPVNYLPRVGASSVTGDLGKAVGLGLRMVRFIVGFRLRTLGRPHARPGARHPVGDTSRTVRLQANAHLPHFGPSQAHVGSSQGGGDGSSPGVASTRRAGATVNG